MKYESQTTGKISGSSVLRQKHITNFKILRKYSKVECSAYLDHIHAIKSIILERKKLMFHIIAFQ
jgi:hypothetical protein